MQTCKVNHYDRQNHQKVVKLLLKVLDESEVPFDLNARDDQGKTAFMHACSNGFEDLVQWMLEHPEKIDVNAIDYSGHCGFTLACINYHLNVTKLLLKL